MWYIILLTHKSGKQYVGRSEHKDLPIEQRIFGMGFSTSQLHPNDFTCEVLAETWWITESKRLRVQYIRQFNTVHPNGFNMRVGEHPDDKSARLRKSLDPKLCLLRSDELKQHLIEKRKVIAKLRLLTKQGKSHWESYNLDELKVELEKIVKNRVSTKVKTVRKKKVRTPWYRLYRHLKTRTYLLVGDFGYKVDQLKAHLESLFTSEMCWENHGVVWQLDHILPIKYFIHKGIYDLSVIHALSNLQPILLIDHKTKNKKDFKLLQTLK